MAKSSTDISVPKRIALVVLGALVLLTFVNLIEAAVNKFKGDDVDQLVVVHEGVVVRGEEGEYHSERVVAKETKAGIGELMIDERFDVSDGENLSVQVGDADIIVSVHNRDEATIKVYLDGKDMERAREYFEDQRFEVTQDGETVFVLTRPVRKNYSWNRMGSPQITVDIAIPAVFNADLKTSDGDVALERLDGRVSIHSSDGDIKTGPVAGPSFTVRTSDGDIRAESVEADEASFTTSDGDIQIEDVEADDISIRTSDGDIRAMRLSGSAGISTSDGDLVIESFSGADLALRTSDGDIRAGEIRANESQVQTSDGSIVLQRVSGSLTAKTSSGDVRVSLIDPGKETYLTTGDGDIQVSVPEDVSAELSLRGERVRISSSFRFDGRIKENEAEGRINGGNALIQARSSDGEVIFREN